MDRRSFLRASGYGMAGAWTMAATDGRAAGDWPAELAAHRIVKIEKWRSSDRYPRTVGPNARSGPHGRGYARPFRTVTTNHGAIGFGMSWAPEAKVGCKALIADGEARKDRAEKPWRYGDYSQSFVDRIFALAEQKLVDVCVFDLGIVGYTRWRRVMPEMKRAGLLASPHLWGGTPRPFYCLHLGAGLGNIPIIEGIPGVGQHLDYSLFRIADGKLHVPRAPGFGIRHRPGLGIGPRA